MVVAIGQHLLFVPFTHSNLKINLWYMYPWLCQRTDWLLTRLYTSPRRESESLFNIYLTYFVFRQVYTLIRSYRSIEIYTDVTHTFTVFRVWLICKKFQRFKKHVRSCKKNKIKRIRRYISFWWQIRVNSWENQMNTELLGLKSTVWNIFRSQNPIILVHYLKKLVHHGYGTPLTDIV